MTEQGQNFIQTPPLVRPIELPDECERWRGKSVAITFGEANNYVRCKSFTCIGEEHETVTGNIVRIHSVYVFTHWSARAPDPQ